jgi:hypothetical protein
VTTKEQGSFTRSQTIGCEPAERITTTPWGDPPMKLYDVGIVIVVAALAAVVAMLVASQMVR